MKEELSLALRISCLTPLVEFKPVRFYSNYPPYSHGRLHPWPPLTQIVDVQGILSLCSARVNPMVVMEDDIRAVYSAWTDRC